MYAYCSCIWELLELALKDTVTDTHTRTKDAQKQTQTQTQTQAQAQAQTHRQTETQTYRRRKHILLYMPRSSILGRHLTHTHTQTKDTYSI